MNSRGALALVKVAAASREIAAWILSPIVTHCRALASTPSRAPPRPAESSSETHIQVK